ncbi:MAG: hypothetical protein NZ700_12580 [Gemmataceae bacterium]|nr:hypothetical protein [Gemmataceae bacterium]MDW8263940.1 hypothetical protein [Gemmataceae bacterium]
MPHSSRFPAGMSILGAMLLAIGPGWAIDYEHEPIRYSHTPANNVITRLQADLDAGKTNLAWTEEHGYLPALLRQLHVPLSSQVLVFSATSQQRHLIGPKSPRAIYFNDEVHIGFVRGGFLELAVADPELGMVFYQLAQDRTATPKFVRLTDNCLSCHGSTRTRDVPGLLVRSVFVGPDAQPILAAGNYRTDQSSPLEQRWGGWYVSGTHGNQRHLGNLVLPSSRKPKTIDNAAGQNVTDLSRFFDVKSYLTPHSDIVALMVLEHQIDAHNYLTRLRFTARLARHRLNESDAKARVAEAVDDLVKQLLFSRETALTAPIQGTSEFARDFAAAGRRDRHGRSLRDFDLQRRIFRYPCSYMVYSTAFDTLPAEVKEDVYRRLWQVLSGEDQREDFQHLCPEDRQAIVQILRDTKADLPAYWR